MKIKRLFGIKYPIFQGGMANIATGKFAAAVSNAGAMGIIGAGGMDTETLEKEIELCKAETDKPFGVNIMLMNPCADEMAELVADEKVSLVTTGAGNPGKYVDMWKSAGIKIFPVVSSVALAKRLSSLGVTGLIAEGCESGGHVGELTTMVLVPQIAWVTDLPVVAAGGIASGKQMAAADILGADGIQVGTILLASEECPIHENYKLSILKAKDNDTVVTGRSVGAPVRILKNPMAREYLKLERSGADKMELEKFTLGALKKAVFQGDVKKGSLMAGQVASMVDEIRPLSEILSKLEKDYEAVLCTRCQSL
ncbi:putative enoyl-[acyl-carrier-protein] reductase II [Eubacterium nodatum ATCC 33099]|nr:putative enoyl-[acyl-carrier-protein] reductase II [Eubacterium nodatum ATCC 33099]